MYVRYQNERDEARRLQSSGNSRKVRKGLDLQHPTSSSMVDDDEEMTLEPPRKRPEWPDWKEARGREEDAWRLEPEGETEVPETVIVADEVEGTHVDSNGEGHHGRGKVKNHRSQSGVPGKECEETKSPKRKVIRVDSEETQDYVREANDMDQEEREEISFVPSAISVPQSAISVPQCSGKPSASGSLRRW